MLIFPSYLYLHIKFNYELHFRTLPPLQSSALFSFLHIFPTKSAQSFCWLGNHDPNVLWSLERNNHVKLGPNPCRPIRDPQQWHAVRKCCLEHSKLKHQMFRRQNQRPKFCSHRIVDYQSHMHRQLNIKWRWNEKRKVKCFGKTLDGT